MRPLRRYSWSEAAGRLLLRQLEGGAYQAEGFVGCVRLAPPHSFIVATCRCGARSLFRQQAFSSQWPVIAAASTETSPCPRSETWCFKLAPPDVR